MTLAERISEAQKVCSDCGRTKGIHDQDERSGRFDHNFRAVEIKEPRFKFAKVVR
jgi:hypothetical protein